MALLPSTSPATLPVGEAKPGDEPKPSPAETGAHTQESMRAFLAYFGIHLTRSHEENGGSYTELYQLYPPKSILRLMFRLLARQ